MVSQHPSFKKLKFQLLIKQLAADNLEVEESHLRRFVLENWELILVKAILVDLSCTDRIPTLPGTLLVRNFITKNGC